MNSRLIDRNKILIDDYFSWRERYFDYLREKIGEDFEGNAREARAIIRRIGPGKYFTHLSDIARYGLEGMAKAFIENPDRVLFIEIRSGQAIMKAKVTDDLFPKMQIVEQVGGKPYGRLGPGEKRYLWQCNELLRYTQQ